VNNLGAYLPTANLAKAPREYGILFRHADPSRIGRMGFAFGSSSPARHHYALGHCSVHMDSAACSISATPTW
jgi:hypothetical protein